MTRIQDMQNIRAEQVRAQSKTMAVSFEMGTERFHVWVDRETFALKSERIGRKGRQVLYANPLDEHKFTEHKPRQSGGTRYLNAESVTWAPFVAHALQVIRKEGAVDKQLAFEQEKAAEQELAAIERRRLERVREAGVELYQALKDILAHPRTDDGCITFMPHEIAAAKAAIALAEKKD